MTAVTGKDGDSASTNPVNLLREFAALAIDHGEIISSW